MLSEPTETYFDHVPVFHWLTPESRRILHTAANRRSFDAGSTIVSEGEPGDCLFVLLEGKVEVLKGIGTPGEAILATLGCNSMFGEMCIVEALERSASVRALTPCVCAALGAEALRNFSEFWPNEHAALLFSLTRELARRLRMADRQFVARSY